MATYTVARGRTPSTWPRRAITNTIAGLLVAGAAGGLTAFQNSHRALLAASVLIVVGGSVWCACTRRIGLALALLMVYLGVLDGYLKLATGSSYVTFIRDALLFSLALGVLVRATVERRTMTLPPLGVWVVGFVVVVLLQLANPNDGSLYHSLAGVRQHLEFVPLFFLTYAYVRTTKALRLFVILLIAIGVTNGIVNVIQFNESPQQLAAWGPGYKERVTGKNQFGLSGRTFYTATGQQQTRPFGLGSDAGDGGLMAAFAIAGVIALASIPRRADYIPLALLAGAVLIAGVITAQGRAVLVCAVVVALAYGLLSVTSRGGFRGLVAILVAILVTAAAYQIVVGGSGRQLRTAQFTLGNVLQTTAHARGFSIARIPKYLVQHPFGDGLGVGGPALGVRGAPPQALTLDSENELNFAIIETGIPGLVVLLGFPLAVIGLGLRRCRREPDPQARLLLAAILAPLAGIEVIYWVSAVSPKAPAGPYLWAVGGIAGYWLVARPRQLRGVQGTSISGAKQRVEQ